MIHNLIAVSGATGWLGLPEWMKAFDAYGIPSVEISGSLTEKKEALRLLSAEGPAASIVNVHPDQSFLPKITSRISSDGKMKSNPIHLIDPQLEVEVAQRVFEFLPDSLKG